MFIRTHKSIIPLFNCQRAHRKRAEVNNSTRTLCQVFFSALSKNQLRQGLIFYRDFLGKSRTNSKELAFPLKTDVKNRRGFYFGSVEESRTFFHYFTMIRKCFFFPFLRRIIPSASVWCISIFSSKETTCTSLMYAPPCSMRRLASPREKHNPVS